MPKYLFSSPASCFVRFLKENTTPKMSFASSSFDSAFRSGRMVSPLLVTLMSDCGLEDFALPEIGRGVHRFVYMHSATTRQSA
jgi:hypothetical protein